MIPEEIKEVLDRHPHWINKDVDLRWADLGGVCLGWAKNFFVPMACSTEGSFIAFKKVKSFIIKLEIPADARRLSATTEKCRCDKAKVLEIQNLDGSNSGRNQIINDNYVTTVYTVGETVFPDSFDENRWNECSHGIHFFVNRDTAVRY